MTDDDGSEGGIHPRWGKVYAIGNQQEDVKVGEWVMVVTWTDGAEHFKLKEKRKKQVTSVVELEVRMIDENDILLVSEDEPEFNSSKKQDTSTWAVLRQMTKLPGND